MKVRGSLTTIGSSNAEATHSSNESHHPTKLMGIMTPQKHMLELIKRNDEWCRRDLNERAELRFFRSSVGLKMTPGSMQHDALHTLARHPFKNIFSADYSKMSRFSKEAVRDTTVANNNSIIGHNIIHQNSSSSHDCVFIPIDGRCPMPYCVTLDKQCVHELVNDGIFIRDKWGTRWWSDDVYTKEYGIGGSHLTCPPCDLPANTQENDSNTESLPTSPPPSVLHSSSQTNDPKPRQVTPSTSNRFRTPRMTYSTLLDDFQPLASDICRRDQRCAQLMHGFICRAREILSDTPTCNMFDELLQSMTSTSNQLKVEVNNNRSNVANEDKSILVNTGNPDDPIQGHIGNPDGPNQLQDMNPHKRPHGACGRQTKRLKSKLEVKRSYVSKNLSGPIGNPKPQKGCSYCGQKIGHNVGSCPDRIEMGQRIPDRDRNQIKYDLQHPSSSRLPWVPIPTNGKKYITLPPKVNFLCIHNYAHMVNIDGTPIISENVETHFLQVTCIWRKGERRREFNECFVRTSAVVGWIDHNKMNACKTLLGTPQEAIDSSAIRTL